MRQMLIFLSLFSWQEIFFIHNQVKKNEKHKLKYFLFKPRVNRSQVTGKVSNLSYISHINITYTFWK